MLVGLGLVLCGCGSSSSSTPTVTTNAVGQAVWSYSMPSSSTPTSCTVTLRGYDAEITFESSSLDVTPACNSWVQSSATSGELWQLNAGTSSSSAVTQVCVLSGASGQATATIMDSGGQMYGQEACTRLISGGWVEQANAAGTMSTSASPTTAQDTTTTESSSGPPEIICPTDANSGAVMRDGCFWAVTPGGGAPYNGSPTPPNVDVYDNEYGCTWHDNGSKGVNSAGPGYEDYTCQ